MTEIPYGYCHCGCGGKTEPWTETDTPRNQIKGEPRRYIHRHHRRRQFVGEGLQRCSICGEVKPEAEFEPHPRTLNGRGSRCRPCANRISRDRSSDPIRQAKVREYARQQRGRHPEKEKARRLLGEAVQSGRIVRPDSCSRCDVPCSPHGHHRDYDKPLEVEWLCPPCHGAEHRRLKEVVNA